MILYWSVGGASWSDHVAVRIFLDNLNSGLELILYLPCEIIKVSNDNYQFQDNGLKDWNLNSGALLNHFHQIFSKTIGIKNSINEIIKAKENGAVLDTSSNGCYERNDKISNSDVILAFTFNNNNSNSNSSNEPALNSGTRYTWDKSKSKCKYHFSLN